MRLVLVPLIAAWAVLAGAQSNTTSSGLPQAIVQVQRTQTGANLVTITISSPSFPQDALKAQSEAIGRNTGSGVRGLQLFQMKLDPKDPTSTLLKSTFAVDGLIDRDRGALALQPIARAMAGVPAPNTIHDFQIDFDFEQMRPTYPGDFSSNAVEVRRSVVQSSLVYDVSLLTQDPRQIVIPDTNVVRKPTVLVQKPANRTDWLLLAAFGIGALAAGALVYSFILVLLRPAAKKGPRT